MKTVPPEVFSLQKPLQVRTESAVGEKKSKQTAARVIVSEVDFLRLILKINLMHS